ncbi:MAG: sugar phosphate nucleotidyltransferase [Gemmatimonadales bacterium]|jgi:mannose-1-phosphate guanylyltransferase
MTTWAVVLAGGSGTRFWPLSTAGSPKQFLPLAGDRPLLQQAVTRLDGLVPPERILVVTGEAHAERTRGMLPALPAENILAEPRAASTAPALTWATASIGQRDSKAVVLSLHADWHVGDDPAFRASAATALACASRHDVLVTVGLVPSRPEVGYGYIIPGDPLDQDARSVARFVEKPSSARARQLISEGALWNSGLFAWTAARFLAETEAHAPEIAPHLRLLEDGDIGGFFAAVTPIAVDVSHFERSHRIAVVPAAFPWDDIGTWGALARVRVPDANGNVLVGDAVAHEAEGCIGWADDGPIVMDGTSNVVVVRANGVTLVTTRERAAHLKALLETLPDRLRDLSP